MRRPRRPARFAAPALAAVLALTAAGCGDDSELDESDPPATESDAPATTQATGSRGGSDDNMIPSPGTDDSGGGRNQPTTSTPSGQTP